MGTERRKQLILGVLVLALAGVVYQAMTSTSSPAAPTSNERDGRAASSQAGSGSVTAPDVHLQALNDDRPKPASDRNLFRFKPKAPPPPPPSALRPTAPVATAPTAPAAPAGPPPPPPITFKFIGLLDQGAGKPKIAVLSDTQGHVTYGTENGSPVDGRFKILRVGAESIEMSYLDGRGRTTIRLTGS
jgi:hypothetical protein